MEIYNVLKRIISNSYRQSNRTSLYDFSVYFLIFIVLAILNYLAFLNYIKDSSNLYLIQILRVLIFLYAVIGNRIVIRRLHDVNKSGWYSLWALTVIGIIPLLYQLIWKKSDPISNQFGITPKEYEKGRVLSIFNVTLLIALTISLILTYSSDNKYNKALEEMSIWKYSETNINGMLVSKSEKLISNSSEYKYDTVFTCVDNELGLVFSFFKIENVHGTNIPIQIKLNGEDIVVRVENKSLDQVTEVTVDKEQNVVITSFSESITKNKLLNEPINYVGTIKGAAFGLTINLQEIENSKVFEKCNIK